MVSSVTPFTDMDPSPRVDVFVDAADLSGSVDELTVWQISSAGEFAVRNAVRRSAAGGFFITDYEVPLGVPVTYRVQEFDSGGTEIAFALSLATQVDISPKRVVMQDPLVPGNAVLVGAEQVFASELKRSRSSRTYRAGNRTVALMGQRGLLEDVPLRCWTETAEQAALLDAVLGETQFLVRSMPAFPIPRLVHVVVPEVMRRPFDYHNGGTVDVWDIRGSEVSRTELDIIVPVVSYARFNGAFASYAEFNAEYSTYLDGIRNPPALA